MEIDVLTKEEVAEFRALLAEARKDGNAEAGQIAKEETAEEKWAREAKIRYAGSGMSPV